jgi:hypothetical protein
MTEGYEFRMDPRICKDDRNAGMAMWMRDWIPVFTGMTEEKRMTNKNETFDTSNVSFFHL